MIFTLNHHTSYSYNKFTCRPAYVVGLTKAFKNKNAQLSVPYGLKAPQYRRRPGTLVNNALPCASMKRNANKSTLLASLNMQNTPGSDTLTYGLDQNRLDVYNERDQNHFFQVKPLLCWKNDLAYYNLRSYFLNTLKALHLCWSAARNNKKIAFIGVDGDLLNQASSSCLTGWFKTQSLARNSIPKLCSTLQKGGFKSLRASGRGKKRLATATALRKTRFYKKLFQSYALWLNTFKRSTSLVENRTNSHKSFVPATGGAKGYTLIPTLMKTYGQSGSFFLSHSTPARLCNPDQVLKSASSHLLCLRKPDLQDRLSANWTQLAHRLGQLGLKAPHNELDHFTPCSSYAELNTKTKSNLAFYDPFSKINVYKRGFWGARPYTKYSAREQTEIIKGLFSKQSPTKHVWLNRKQRIKPYLQRVEKAFRGRFVLNHRNKAPFQRESYLFRTKKSQRKPYNKRYKPGIFKKRFYKTHYNNMLQRIEFYDRASFVTNPNLKQADILFFIHPDKSPGMVTMARNLRIPTIGIVSGLKSKGTSRFKPTDLADGVNYPIVGNADNNFFVLLLLRTFMRVIRKANAT